MRCPFDAIVVTAPNTKAAEASEGELRVAFERVAGKAAGEEVQLLAVSDPKGARIGSGGGTINALDAAARALVAARLRQQGANLDAPGDNKGYQAPLEEVLAVAAASRILVVHSGGDSQRSPLQSVCGKAWCTLSSSRIEGNVVGKPHPSEQLAPPRTPLELLLFTLFRMSNEDKAAGTSSSVQDKATGLELGSSVIACADVLLLVPSDLHLGFVASAIGSATGSVTGLAIAAETHFGPHHGVYRVEEQHTCGPGARNTLQHVTRFYQKETVESLRAAGAILSEGEQERILVDTGVVAFNLLATSAILRLAVEYPLNGTTLSAYVRHERQIINEDIHGRSGGPNINVPPPKPVRVELYSDILLAVDNVGGFYSPSLMASPCKNTSLTSSQQARELYLAFLGGGGAATGGAVDSIVTSQVNKSKDPITLAREALWNALNSCSFGVACAFGQTRDTKSGHPKNELARFGHLGTTLEQMQMIRGEMSDFVAPFNLRSRVLAHESRYSSCGRTSDNEDARRGTPAPSAHSLDPSSSSTSASPDAVVVNSRLVLVDSDGIDTSPRIGVMAGAVVEHSDLRGQWYIGEGAMVSGVRHTGIGSTFPNVKYQLHVPPFMCVQENTIILDIEQQEMLPGVKSDNIEDMGSKGHYFTVTLLGVRDGVKDMFEENTEADKSPLANAASDTMTKKKEKKVATFCGMPWCEIFQRCQGVLSPSDIWPNSTLRRDLWHANLFPVCCADAEQWKTKGDEKREGALWRDAVLQDWRSSPEVIFWPFQLASGVAVGPTILNKWKSLSRMSLKDLLSGKNLCVKPQNCRTKVQASASPQAEFAWRHRLEVLVGREIVADAQVLHVAPATATASNFVYRRTAPTILEEDARKESSIEKNVEYAFSADGTGIIMGRVQILDSFSAKAPARVDIAGGWSDTPPISYEHGGAVVNLAVLFDGEHPIHATVEIFEWIDAPAIAGNERHTPTKLPLLLLSTRPSAPDLGIDSLDGIRDFNRPSAPAALLKAALLCAGAVRLDQSRSGPSHITSSWEALHSELQRGFPLFAERCRVAGDANKISSFGVRIATHSMLPQGSGLGTSSILAGTLLAALGYATGRPFCGKEEIQESSGQHPVDAKEGAMSLVHQTLVLEQMLTTGGGWQDQVGGLVPGSPAKISRSDAALPLQVTVDDILLHSGSLASDVTSPTFCATLDARLVLIFTGQPRLAKHLLVEVIRRWWSAAGSNSSADDKDEEVLQLESNTDNTDVRRAMQDLVANANDCAAEMRAGNLVGVGRCLSRYHELKRIMVGDSYEPPIISQLIRSLRPFSYGLALCGAGGGGFLAVILKEPYEEKKKLSIEIAAAAAAAGGTVHRAELVGTGVVVSAPGNAMQQPLHGQDES